MFKSGKYTTLYKNMCTLETASDYKDFNHIEESEYRNVVCKEKATNLKKLKTLSHNTIIDIIIDDPN